ncbi:MAG: flagellar filament capping protein FliD [Helicobacteraceae bacterium]|jgi:flagellar hook-associated protein 2|nr:flagellar filament capping protein FliD [Helicobacteraceae bacterium]
MAVGTVNMLGVSLGGESVLNADLIDQLKEADKSVMIKPIEDQLTKLYKKQEDQTKLTEYLSTFFDIVEEFSEDLTYMKRNVTVSGDAVSVTANDGVDVQDFSIKVTQLAQNTVMQSQKYENQNSVFSETGGRLEIKQGSSTLSIDVHAGMTLSELRDEINNRSDGKITASILNTGGDNPYSLVIRANDSGTQNALEFKQFDSSGNEIVTDPSDGSYDADALLINLESVQEAQDAKFLYNNIEIVRSSNSVDDLISGVTIDLKKTMQDTESPVQVSIGRDLSVLSESLQKLTDAYNTLTKFLNDITKYDSETGESGSFLGDSRINAIKSEINKIFFGENEDRKSIADINRPVKNSKGEVTDVLYAFNLSENGTLSFDQSVFDYAAGLDPDMIERLFRGYSDVTPSYTVGSTVTTLSGEISDLTINGVSIGNVTFNAGASVSDNLILILNAINKISAQTGVSAKLGGAGTSLILTNATGGEFTVGGSDASVAGLKTGSYKGTESVRDGLFVNLDTLGETINGILGESTMKLVKDELSVKEKNLTEGLQKVLDRLNAKYDLMTTQFASYNAIISRYQSSFNSVQMLIDQAAADKS